jgi:hypothetical protein
MPVRKKSNGKWTFSDSGHPEYDSRAAADRSYNAYLAKKYSKKRKK